MPRSLEQIAAEIAPLKARLDELYIEQREARAILKQNKKPIAHQQQDKMLALALAGKTIEQIAGLLNFRPSTVRSYLRGAIRSYAWDRFPYNNYANDPWQDRLRCELQLAKRLTNIKIQPRTFWPWKDKNKAQDGLYLRDFVEAATHADRI